jgi:rare lipoprotein A (peptidoglycan hydrolase)
VRRPHSSNTLDALVRTVAIATLLVASMTVATPATAFAAMTDTVAHSVPMDDSASVAPRIVRQALPGRLPAPAADTTVSAHPSRSVVPDVVRVSGKTAASRLRAAGYVVKLGKPRYDAKARKGCVAAQVAKGGSHLRVGREVTIYPSLGKQPAYVWKTAKASVYGGSGESQSVAGPYGSTSSLERAGRLYFAHKTMGFGTRILFSYRGRTAIAICVDRGPYVSGRAFDLGHNTAQALGLDGVGTVSWTVVK